MDETNKIQKYSREGTLGWSADYSNHPGVKIDSAVVLYAIAHYEREEGEIDSPKLKGPPPIPVEIGLRRFSDGLESVFNQVIFPEVFDAFVEAADRAFHTEGLKGLVLEAAYTSAGNNKENVVQVRINNYSLLQPEEKVNNYKIGK